MDYIPHTLGATVPGLGFPAGDGRVRVDCSGEATRLIRGQKTGAGPIVIDTSVKSTYRIRCQPGMRSHAGGHTLNRNEIEVSSKAYYSVVRKIR